MSKKKSYMDNTNIIQEGFFETLKKYLIKYPKLKKDKKVRSSLKSLNHEIKELEKMFRDLDPKNKRLKLSKYKLTDFI
tara:strand:- start:48 stop:281 length:234 start_codon:yes stop_codon:yes gene_type:complete